MLPPIDELVQSVSLYKPYAVLLHGYILPFIISYTSWFILMTFVYGWEEYTEIGFILLALIGCIQILTCLFCHWFVHIRCLFTCREERSPWKAQLAKVVPTANNGSTELVKLHKSYNENLEIEEVWFIFQKSKYILEEERKQFKPLPYPIDNSFLYYSKSKGLVDQKTVDDTSKLYGLNNLKMDTPEFMELFRDRATAPFFVFQVFCVGLWCLDEYWYYSLFTLLMLIIFECTLVQQQLRNMSEIRKMGTKPYPIQVYRQMTWKQMMTDDLLPGDIISIGRSQNDNLVPCDLLLLRGPCVVDESMLTGESVPQMKESLEAVELDKVLDLTTDSRLHTLFGGTKVVQYTSPVKQPLSLKAPDNGCICYVLRTSFSTAQGRLLRTILYSVSRITANTLETFAFIMFLLVFAITAASYVWIEGTKDPERNRYKLFLECTLILTSVVPPELPIELSLAVNTSLLALSKLAVFCTEPFRIPFAGKVDVCCFDKTGTLTSDELILEGVTGINESTEIISAQEAPFNTMQVLASCHSLVQVDEGLVGDPQEKVTLSEIGWYLNKGDSIFSKKGKSPPLRIAHRFHFSSQLKRMSVIASYTAHGMIEPMYIASVKGAPEMLKDMFCSVPENYNEMYQKLTRRGARVLALGRKELGRMYSTQARQISRDFAEKDLEFVGFIIFSCPLKKDSLGVIKEILASSHAVVMITGDSSLTACHVANELKFTGRSAILCLEKISSKWYWRSINEQIEYEFEADSTKDEIKSITDKHDLCVTGEGFTWLINENPDYLWQIFSSIKVFARVAPKEKQQIITTYKSQGYTTLMCGDGTNDVGALKHAHCGVAILSHGFEKPLKSIIEKQNNEVSMLDGRNDKDRRFGKKDKFDKSKIINEIKSRNSKPIDPRLRRQEDIQKLLKELENFDQNQLVKLGDASIAAPFTSKRSSIICVNHIIKQGRCTLVTTLQMFKILALNALIHAYSHSVLYIDGIKFSDYQATLQGILLAFCFLFISRSKPLKTLSSARPLANIFNMYTISTVLLQFCVHFYCLIILVQQAKIFDPPRDSPANLEKEFAPSVLNSTVYIISMTLQISTFAINYRGHPFMESLLENKALLYSLLAAGGLVMTLALGISPQFAYQFEIVEFPEEFRRTLVKILLADFFCSLAIDRFCLFVFGEGKLSRSLRRR